ncbi:MAG: Flp pilus assembly protein CpaB [Chloroflexota bacterium]
MTAKRMIVALVVALVVSGLFTYLLGKRINSARLRTSNHQFVATAKPVEPGEMLKPASLAMLDWPANVPLPGAFAKPEDLNGRIVLYPLALGEPILERHLAAVGSGAGLSAKIPEGMRAISLKSDEVVGVAGFLLPGTHVDVLETDRSVSNGTHPDTSTVLQDVEVLAAGQKIEPDPEGKPSSVNVVTLLLKPEDAEKVVLASSVGVIHFVLRNGSDRTRIAEAEAPQPTVRQARPHLAIAPAPQPYLVETQLGDKKVVTSFN